MWRSRVAAVSRLVLAVILPVSAGAGESFSGTVETKAGPIGFTLAIAEVTSDDATMSLAETILGAGQEGVIQALRPLAAGSIEFASGVSYTANVIRSRQMEAGRLVVAVTHRPLELPGAASPAKGMGYLELTLKEDGSGAGRVLPSCEIVFGEDGYLEARSLGPPEAAIRDVAPAQASH